MLHHAVDRNGPTESPLRVCACLSSGGFVALILAAVCFFPLFWPSESLVYVALPALWKIVAHTQEVAMEAKRKLDDQGRQNSAVDRLLTALNSFLTGHKSSHLVKIGSRSALGEAREQAPRATPAPDLSDHLIKCHSHGVYSPALDECRCTAGWNGRWCSVRMARRCNAAADGSILMRDSLCAGDCDEDRGSCYCAAAGRSRRWSRPLPYTCAPAAHRKSKLPDGRPAYPVLAVSAETGVPRWKMANMYFESNKKSPHFDYTRSDQVPFEWIYGQVGSNPPSPGVDQQHAKVPFCTAPSTVHRQLTGCADGGCPEGRAGEYCEHPKQSFCLRDCSGHGWCDAGFCWCKAGWFGIDCSQHHTLPNARSLQEEQRLPSPAARHSKLRVYVYDMPSEFTTMLLQYRLGAGQGLSRMITSRNRSVHNSGSLYAMELAFHEWILDAPLRTTKSEEAHLFFVPIYLSSIFMWPVVKFADQPYYGASEQAPRHRSHQATLLMLRALSYIQRRYPFWNRRGGRDHIWMMLHDEGPCFCPREIRPSILLTHYGYHAINPRPWTTFFDDNFLADQRFFLRHLSDEKRSQLTRYKAPCILS
ncbi:hypothetical protein AB1Y20_018410 [Prymnesium parvum]|uniref:EGF-like domain-containing protein n=1 Tax=Prymnesium parvum TaxID=97485 RepID=A0AB34JRY4_PRYPA